MVTVLIMDVVHPAQKVKAADAALCSQQCFSAAASCLAGSRPSSLAAWANPHASQAKLDNDAHLEELLIVCPPDADALADGLVLQDCNLRPCRWARERNDISELTSVYEMRGAAVSELSWNKAHSPA